MAVLALDPGEVWGGLGAFEACFGAVTHCMAGDAVGVIILSDGGEAFDGVGVFGVGPILMGVGMAHEAYGCAGVVGFRADDAEEGRVIGGADCGGGSGYGAEVGPG